MLPPQGPLHVPEGEEISFAPRLDSYQRGSRERPPSEPPPGRRPPPPRPEPPPSRSTRGRASETFKGRPSNSVPFSPAMAFSAASSSVISTNAKPRGLPVSRSVMMLTRSTAPKPSNNVRRFWVRSASAKRNGRFPTNIFFIVDPHCGPGAPGPFHLGEEFGGKTSGLTGAGEVAELESRVKPHP